MEKERHEVDSENGGCGGDAARQLVQVLKLEIEDTISCKCGSAARTGIEQGK